MTTSDKRALLVELIELSVFNAHDISPLVGKPLSYFNYEAIKQAIAELQNKSLD